MMARFGLVQRTTARDGNQSGSPERLRAAKRGGRQAELHGFRKLQGGRKNDLQAKGYAAWRSENPYSPRASSLLIQIPS